MLEGASAVAFLPSTDLARSLDFFAEQLKLTLLEENPYACVFQCGHTMLRVTLVEDLRVQPFTVFGWDVPDIRQVLAQLAAAGVSPIRYDGMNQEPGGVWTAPGGDLVAWLADPDGNTLSLTQFVRSPE